MSDTSEVSRSADPETLESLRKRAVDAEEKARYFERKKLTVADLAKASHRWNMKERARLRKQANDAEAAKTRVTAVLEEFMARSETVAERTCTGSISSRETHARAAGYAEVARRGLDALKVIDGA